MLDYDVNSPTNVSPRPEPPKLRNMRRALLGIYESPRLAYQHIFGKPVNNFMAVLWYASLVPSRKPRTPMDVEKMVADWREFIVGMTLAHDKKAVDEYEAKLNDLLEPFLKAPVKQIREFCQRLIGELRDDVRVPLFIRAGVESYINVIVKGAKDTKIVELKKDIAGRIAKAVEGDVQPQLAEAITNALMWRDPETLEKIEGAAKKGHKAKLVGRESCLFLEIGGETVML